MLGVGRHEVGGTVNAADGNPLPMIRVELQSTVGGLILTTYTSSEGRFLFNGVPEGNYSVVVRAPGYETGNWPVEVGYHGTVGLVLMLTPLSFGQPRDEAFAKDSTTVSVRQLRIPDKARKEFRKGAESESHGKIDEAIKHWEKSIQIYPQFAESYMELSKVYVNRGDFDHATESAKHAIEIDGKDAAPYAYLGFVYLKAKDFPKATEAFQSSVRLSDSLWFSQFWLGDLLLRQKNSEEAYPHLLRASQLNPGVPGVYVLLYNDLVLLGRGEEALAKIDDFLVRFPNNPMAAEARDQRNRLAKSLDEKRQ